MVRNRGSWSSASAMVRMDRRPRADRCGRDRRHRELGQPGMGDEQAFGGLPDAAQKKSKSPMTKYKSWGWPAKLPASSSALLRSMTMLPEVFFSQYPVRTAAGLKKLSLVALKWTPIAPICRAQRLASRKTLQASVMSGVT